MEGMPESGASISPVKIIIAVSLFLILADNVTFFRHVLEFYPLSRENVPFLASLVLVCAGLLVTVLSLCCLPYTSKPVLITLLLLTSLTSYFMDSYNTVIDPSMIKSIINTDTDEVLDLLNLKLALYFIFLGVVPALAVYRVRIHYRPLWRELFTRLATVCIILAAATLAIMNYGDFYSSFIREHKPLRYYSNPAYYLYSAAKYAGKHYAVRTHALTPLGLDAAMPADAHNRLVIFVVGEAARSDRFSLNGYRRLTNPLLQQDGAVSFTNFWSCGTSTAVSVPCMFSAYGRRQISSDRARSSENLLDLLHHAGVSVLWLDNNSSSKGVADRVAYRSYRGRDANAVCDIECRDEGMLVDLQDYINRHKGGDIFIVLHQMGNHGPDYYKRYPQRFRKYNPVCRSNLLEECSRREINNAYDNAILYTDYFLDRVIGLLKHNSDAFETAMFYVSDHGESLGEHGIYLHGLPYILAPEAQLHVAAIMWIGATFKDLDNRAIARVRARRYSHDNIFHTVLGLLGISASVYDGGMDIVRDSLGPRAPELNIRQRIAASGSPAAVGNRGMAHELH